MNIYVLVEGISEKIIYEKWIPLVNPSLKLSKLLNEVDQNCFYIISGGGYPSYFEVIDDAIETINTCRLFDRLIISVDSEEFTKEGKYNEILEYLTYKDCIVPIYIVIQHFCIETWLLGNYKIGPRNPKSQIVKMYKNIFNVLTNDPELLPQCPDRGYNRAQFALSYLKSLLNDKNKKLTYSKGNPKVACHQKYYIEVNKRFTSKNHISSFGDFINALSP